MRLKRIISVLSIMTMTAALTACGGNGKTNEEENVQEIVIGTAADYEPYTYLDDEGEVAGYDMELMKKIDELLPQYEFTYETTEFESLLVGLDNGKYDIAVNEMGKNEEREKKYDFSEPYAVFTHYILVKSDRDDISSLEDLAGKSCFADMGGQDEAILKAFNEEHPDNPIEIVYHSYSPEETALALESGKIDAIIVQKTEVDTLNEVVDNVCKAVGEPVQVENSYFVYAKGQDQLVEDVNEALAKLKEDGTLEQLSTDILGFNMFE